MSRELIVNKIKDGTVIDHIDAGRALYVLKILDVENFPSIISMAMNVESKKLHGKKDIVKIENRKLDLHEIDKISLFAPKATINYIENYEVVEKRQVELLSEYRGILKCSNPECITNVKYNLGNKEPVETSFRLVEKNPIILECEYCGRFLENDIHKYLIF